MKAAKECNIDYRWIYLWAEHGLVSHLEVEGPDGRHKTYYVLADIERQVELLHSKGIDTPAYPEGYWESVAHKLGLDRLVGALAETG